jgi:hypothetical protein
VVLTHLRFLYRPRPKPEFGEDVGDEGWNTGGDDSDGGQPPKLVDPYEHLKDPVTGTKGISSLTINDDAPKHIEYPITEGASSQTISDDASTHVKGPIAEGMSSLTIGHDAFEQFEDPITTTEAMSSPKVSNDSQCPTTATGGIWVNDDAFAQLNDPNTNTEGSSNLFVNDDKK